MPRSLPASRLVRRAAAAAALAAAAATVPVSPAHALLVTTGPEGLELREPNLTLDRVGLSLVDSGGATRYRVEMPEFGGRGLQVGPGCTFEEPTRGVHVAVCDRLTPRVTVGLGPMDDTFAVDPSFPDPITIFGGLGDDRITLGAGDDAAQVLSGADSIDGGAGADDLDGTRGGGSLRGGDGDDRLSGGQDADLDGGPGDDVLTMARDGLDLVRGGPGRDTFTGEGSALRVDARDGIAEAVACGTGGAGAQGTLAGRFSLAVVDLLDTPDDAALAAGGCANVDRAPVGETTAVAVRGRTVRLRGGTALVRVACVTARPCAGRAGVAMGTRRATTVRYRIAARRTATVRVPARRGAARATVTLAERGVRGARTVRAQLTVAR
jgi:hypothetical protein